MASYSNESYGRMLEQLNNGPTFAAKSGVRITAAGSGTARGELENRVDTQNPMGMIHGGALFTLADTVAGVAAYTTGRSCVTLDSSMQFLAAARGDKVFCTAAPRKIGRTVLVYDVSITESEDRLIASGTFTFYATGEHRPKED